VLFVLIATRHVVRKAPPRERDYLRPDEANRLIIAAGKRGRNPLRDVVLLRLIYRHGLRATEARLARWSQFDLDNAGIKTFRVQRVKGSEDSTHTLDRDEIVGLRKLREAMDGPFAFASDRGGPISADVIAGIVSEAAEAASIGFHVHPPPHAPPQRRSHAGRRGFKYAVDPRFLGPSGYSEHRQVHQTQPPSAGERAGAVSFRMDELVT
jgi:integrase